MKNEFILQKSDYKKEDIVLYGNMFLLGNGHLGYRGTLEEYRKEQLIGLNIVGFYDQYKDLWRESLNAPNPFFVEIDGHNILKNDCISHNQELDIKHEVFMRDTIFEDLEIHSQRTISQVEDNLLPLQYEVKIKKELDLNIKFGLDTDIYDINGPHFKSFDVIYDELISFVGITNENKKLFVDVKYDLVGGVATFDEKTKMFYLKKHVLAGETIKLNVYCKLYELERKKEDVEKFKNIISQDIRHLFTSSKETFAKKWDIADVVIKGDELAQFGIRYSIYHLLILGNEKYTHSIPARGLSGQTYKGAIFWDTEIFIFPFFLMINPKIARNLLKYRINTLNGAIAKAKEYGYEGAFYSWESQETGLEACSKYNVTDPRTNEPIRTYFNEKQIHISADIVFAFHQYLSLSKDYSLLLEGGYEVIKQVLLFLMSYAKLMDDGLYHFNDVIGPDEYHERIDDNVFTSYMNYESVKIFIHYYNLIKNNGLKDLKSDEELFFKAQEFLNKIYLPPMNEQLLFEQFKGYFDLEDVTVDTVRNRLSFEKEYWGGKNGVATPTRVIKQADVVALLALLSNKFDDRVVKANYDFYSKYTEHGSSLSSSMYCQCACRIGYLKEAYQFFLKSATIDLGMTPTKMFAGGIYIGGTHPASNGGAYLSMLKGFAGMKVVDGKIEFHPHLPKEIEELTFKYCQQDKIFKVHIKGDNVVLKEEI